MTGTGTRIPDRPRTATALDIAKWIRHHCDAGDGPRRPGVAFLIGAGFSKSAGIPLAGEIVQEFLKPHPLLEETPEPQPGQSAYAYYMRRLPAVERAKIIRTCIEAAVDPETNRTRINWAHLLLATMVDAGYVTHILTTNFDPLAIDALALTGQPVRVFDLTASDFYHAGALQPGSIVYLHGQASGPLLANTDEETRTARQHLNVVFQDALQQSMLIVIGYSGVCDPVLQELTRGFRQFAHRLTGCSTNRIHLKTKRWSC
jgi:NAD-dependent SIR2 family protein deacetylase